MLIQNGEKCTAEKLEHLLRLWIPLRMYSMRFKKQESECSLLDRHYLLRLDAFIIS